MKQRRFALSALGVFTLFIFYGTLIPFRFAWPDSTRLSSINLTPFVNAADGSRASIPDIVQNILLFLPFGALLFVLNALRSRGGLVRYGGVLIGGVVLSCLVECLQLFTTDRVVSVTDVLMNGIGAVAGAVLVTLGTRLARRVTTFAPITGLLDSVLFPVAATFVVFTLVSQFEPFDFTLDVGSVYGKIKSLFAVKGPLTEVFRDELRMALIGGLVLYFVKALWVERERRFGVSQAIGCVAALWVLEGAQFIVGSRSPAIRDVLILSAGGLVGMSLVSTRPHLPTLRMVVVVYLLTSLAVCVEQWSPFSLSGKQFGVQWFPFLSSYERTSFVVLSTYVETLLYYFPAGYLLALSAVSIKRIIALSIVTLVFVMLTEYGQSFFGRYADITSVLSMMAGWTGGLIVGRYHGAATVICSKDGGAVAVKLCRSNEHCSE